jgi:hypothetical protein
MKTTRLVRFWILLLQLLDLGSLAADDDARARGVDVDLQVVGRALGLDARDTGVREALLEVLPQGADPRGAASGSRGSRTSASARSC